MIFPHMMATASLKDCYISLDGDILTIGNSKIQRHFDAQKLTFLATTDRVSGKVYEGDIPMQVPILDMRATVCRVSTMIDDNCGASEEFLVASLRYMMNNNELTIRFEIFPELPFVSTAMTLDTEGGSYPVEKEIGGQAALSDFDRSQMLDGIVFGGKHRKMTRYTFYDASDHRSQTVRSQTFHLYHKGKHDEWGNIFHVTDTVSGDELLLVKNSPVCQSHLSHIVPDLRIEGGTFMLCGTGFDYNDLDVGTMPFYGTTVGVGKDLMRAHRDLMRALNKGTGTLFCMENTWGDRNCDKKLCDAFIRREIDAAAAVGVDYVQIDDGWAKGTVDTKEGFLQHIWEGYYDADPDYWTVSKKKFPDGFAPLTAYAKEKGVELGLWFSPDSSNDMRHWQDDVETIYDFYETYNFRGFKLDGIKIRTKRAENRMTQLIKELTRRSRGGLHLQLDVTNDQRFGFLYRRAFGTVFVQNRYTDFGNYYPHETLRNLWTLAEVLPTRQFQFEFLNNRRNVELYGDDPLAPASYGIDYLFAVTMMSNPLVWMEVSELDARDIPTLARAVGVWRTCRDDLFRADVTPIGEMPSGFGFTGFYADCGDVGYALLFRELAETDTHTFSIPALTGDGWSAAILDASTGATEAVRNGLRVEIVGDGIKAVFPSQRAYAFVKVEKQ